MGRSAGSGNATWKAVMRAHEWKPGRPGMRKCSAIARWSGLPCGNVAMRGVKCCFKHGGRGQQALIKWREAKRAQAPNESRHLARKFKRAGNTSQRGSERGVMR